MNVEFGNEAVQFPDKEYINGIFVAVWSIFRGLWPLASSFVIVEWNTAKRPYFDTLFSQNSIFL
jgi:hypothetical protein